MKLMGICWTTTQSVSIFLFCVKDTAAPESCKLSKSNVSCLY